MNDIGLAFAQCPRFALTDLGRHRFVQCEKLPRIQPTVMVCIKSLSLPRIVTPFFDERTVFILETEFRYGGFKSVHHHKQDNFPFFFFCDATAGPADYSTTWTT